MLAKFHFSRDRVDLLNDAVDNIGVLHAFLDLLVSMVSLPCLFNRLAACLGPANRLQVSCLCAYLLFLEQEAWEGLRESASSARGKSHLSRLNKEVSIVRVFLDFIKDIAKAIFFKTKLAHFCSTSAHLCECFA